MKMSRMMMKMWLRTLEVKWIRRILNHMALRWNKRCMGMMMRMKIMIKGKAKPLKCKALSLSSCFQSSFELLLFLVF